MGKKNDNKDKYLTWRARKTKTIQGKGTERGVGSLSYFKLWYFRSVKASLRKWHLSTDSNQVNVWAQEVGWGEEGSKQKKQLSAKGLNWTWTRCVQSTVSRSVCWSELGAKYKRWGRRETEALKDMVRSWDFILSVVGAFWFRFFKRFNFIYFWLRWVFVAASGLSLVAASGNYSSLRCVGFSLLQSTGSRCMGFSSCGTRA